MVGQLEGLVGALSFFISMNLHHVIVLQIWFLLVLLQRRFADRRFFTLQVPLSDLFYSLIALN